MYWMFKVLRRARGAEETLAVAYVPWTTKKW